jgi:hypothetical protein
MNRMNKLLCASLVTLAYSASGFAAVTAEEAAALGKALTPWGAEKAGNKAGTIPAYGDGIKAPASYDKSKPGVRPDPFADDKVLYSVTAANLAAHADKLSEGTQTMLKKYPNMRIDVYPTRRTMEYPDWVQANSIKNATACKAGESGLSLEGCYSGVPFPVPKNGNEVMWNHIVKYSSPDARAARFQSWVVDASGHQILQGEQDGTYTSEFFNKDWTGPVPTGVDFYQLRVDITGPARKAGEKRIILESTKMGANGTRVWQYLPAQRRVKQSPDLAYDTPQPQSGGAQTMDDVGAFQGALDRFDFKLIGKKEMLIPYNTFKMHAGGTCSLEKLLTPSFMNPDCIRWELHRVWVVEGALKEGARHVYKKRMFYFDEDAPAAGVSDSFDHAGKPYRANWVLPYAFYEGEGHSFDASVTYDLSTGIYATTAIATELGGFKMIPRKSKNYYTADSLTTSGIR